MPEMKRVFQAGKMNRNQDERLVKPGEYREALNIGVGRSETADIGAVENILGNVEISNENRINNGKCIGILRDNGNERIYFFVTSNDNEFEQNDGEHGVFEYDQKTGSVNPLCSGEWLNFHQNFLITGINLVDDLLFWTDDRNEPRKIQVTRARNDKDYYDSDDLGALAVLAPTSAPSVVRWDEEGTSDFLQEKLVRFAYRFKFNDGEFSTISPFTPIVFGSTAAVAELTEDNFKSGELPFFVNKARRIFLEFNVPVNAGITAVEILYNESRNTNIYILDELAAETDDKGSNDPVVVEYTYEAQDPFKTLPGSQLTRVYDAIPRRAKSQEFAGGRIIYGNYLQNFNPPVISYSVDTVPIAHNPDNPFNRMSVKSRRTYQVGLVLADKFGRQTPVLLSTTGGDTVNVEPKTGGGAMQQLRLNLNTSNFPDWAYSYRVVIKQREQEYYNWFFSNEDNGFPSDEQPADNQFLITGGNINKVPRDSTVEGIFIGNKAVAQSNVRVFPKYSTTSSDVDLQDVGVLSVDELEVDAAVGGFPLAKVLDSGITGGSTGRGVFETFPVESELDIYYETSSAGLISEIEDKTILIDYFNCYVLNIGLSEDETMNSHLELNRVRAKFNYPWFTIGLKAYVTQENFAEQRRFNTLIHSSGLFNSRVGINFINQFNESEGGLTVSLDPADGSIQKLYAEDTQLIICQEDKISRSPIDKDFIYSAEGGAIPVTSSTQYLGTISPYAGEYGISTNPESFAVYGTRKYFTDKNRGVALRLSNNGLSEISENGMVDFFRDALKTSTQVIGSFDEYHDQYNVTIIGTDAYGGFEDTNIATGKDGFFTLSYEEEVNGWVSFKSFQQEFGTTLNNRYYTLNGGRLWEHNHLNAEYNNFYSNVYESYLECIMNDSPSDVKDFKTVGYEGKTGWQCEQVITDIDSYALDPDANQLDEITLATLVVNESVTEGKVTGTNAQSVVTGNDYHWVIKVEPSTPQFIIREPSDGVHPVTCSVDGVDIEPQYYGKNVYFRTQDFRADQSIQTHTAIIEGGAMEEVEGAILNISVVNSIGLDDVTLTIPEIGDFANDFKAGDAILSYEVGATDPNVSLQVSVNDSTKEINTENTLNYVYSSGVSTLPSGDPEYLNIDASLFYRQNIILPSIQKNGVITVSQVPGSNVIIDKPIVTYIEPTDDGDNTTEWTKYYLSPDNTSLNLFNDDEQVGYYASGSSYNFWNLIIIGNFANANPPDLPYNTGTIIKSVYVAEDDEVMSVTTRRLDRETMMEEGITANVELMIGAIQVQVMTKPLVRGTNLDIDLTVGAETIDITEPDYSVRLNDAVAGDNINLGPDDTAYITIDDVRNCYYYVVPANDAVDKLTLGDVEPGTEDDKTSGGILEAGETYVINREGGPTAGQSSIFIVLEVDTNKFRGTLFDEGEIDVNLTV